MYIYFDGFVAVFIIVSTTYGAVFFGDVFNHDARPYRFLQTIHMLYHLRGKRCEQHDGRNINIRISDGGLVKHTESYMRTAVWKSLW
jgi:hypothetical protein